MKWFCSEQSPPGSVKVEPSDPGEGGGVVVADCWLFTGVCFISWKNCIRFLKDTLSAEQSFFVESNLFSKERSMIALWRQ